MTIKEAFRCLMFYGTILGLSVLVFTCEYNSHRTDTYNYQVGSFLLMFIYLAGLLVGGIGTLVSLWGLISPTKREVKE